MTNDRKTAFRNAFQNLQLLPLVKPEDIRRFRVDYAQEILEQLNQRIEECPADDNKIIFTGHRGSGKSTLLGQLALDISDNYFVVFFSIADLIEGSDVDHVTILFAMSVMLMETAEDRKVKIDNITKQAFYRWFSQHTKIETSDTSFSSEIEAIGQAGSDLWFLKFFAKIKAILKENEIIREEIKTEFGRRISDLVDRVNDIAAAIQGSSGRDVLVIIDDLDKLSLNIAVNIFCNNISLLFRPYFCIVYTIPMAAMRDISFRGIVASATNNPILCIWAMKLFPRGYDKIDNAKPIESAEKFFREVLQKRLPNELIDEDVIFPLIVKSGGSLRELIRLASRCCQNCSMQLRRNPEDQDVRITAEILQKAVTELRIEFEEPLGQKNLDILQEIYHQYTPRDSMDQIFLDLLHFLYIWFGLHPIVRDILVLRKLA
jgi:energy-coupling factor transporter ATP-binding protein EcfA2